MTMMIYDNILQVSDIYSRKLSSASQYISRELINTTATAALAPYVCPLLIMVFREFMVQ